MRTVLSLSLLAAAAPAQNLLAWDDWQPWNGQYVTQLAITPASISFAPYAPGITGAFACGVEQQILVPEAGTYQLHFLGGGGSTGVFSAHWEIQGQQTQTFFSHEQQRTWTFQLAAGSTTLRLHTLTSNLSVDLWYFEQPVLRPVLPPAVDIELVRSSMPTAAFTADAEFLLIAPQSQLPVRLPGFLYGLELAPTSAVAVLAAASSPPATLQIYSPSLAGQSWPSFYLQALSLSPVLRFGAALRVEPWRF